MIKMNEEKTIVYSYNKDTKIYTIDYKEMQKINRQLKERFSLRQEKKQLQNNWNELKKFINTGYYDSYMYSSTVLKKMEELEGKSE
jgi:hypothetical protein